MKIIPEQYEMCKKRKHEAPPKPAQPQSFSAMQNSAQNYSPWTTCRWCGCEYMEIPEIRQVERKD